MLNSGIGLALVGAVKGKKIWFFLEGPLLDLTDMCRIQDHYYTSRKDVTRKGSSFKSPQRHNH